MTDFISNMPDEHQPIWVAVGHYSNSNRGRLWKVITIPTSKASAEIYAEMANEDELTKPKSRRRHHFVIKMDSPADYTK